MMRVVAITLLTLSAAHAAESTFQFEPHRFREWSRVDSCIEMHRDLPRIAERLGVKPIDKAAPPERSMVLSMCDGRQYDFIEIMNVFLDKLDRK
jgi:hypothetical protein